MHVTAPNVPYTLYIEHIPFNHDRKTDPAQWYIGYIRTHFTWHDLGVPCTFFSRFHYIVPLFWFRWMTWNVCCACKHPEKDPIRSKLRAWLIDIFRMISLPQKIQFTNSNFSHILLLFLPIDMMTKLHEWHAEKRAQSKTSFHSCTNLMILFGKWNVVFNKKRKRTHTTFQLEEKKVS